MIDTKLLHRRQKFSSLVDSYVIFITEHDIIGANLPIYHIDRIVRETAADFGDGSHIIYVNADIDSDDTPLARLMHDFKCKKAAEMYYPQLACRVSMIKNTEGGRDTMCEIMERLNEKAADEAVKKALRSNSINTAKALISNGKLSHEEIAQISGLTLDEVKAIAAGKLS